MALANGLIAAFLHAKSVRRSDALSPANVSLEPKKQCQKTCGLCGSTCTDLDGNCCDYTSYCDTENTCDRGVRATGAKNMVRAIREVAGSSPVLVTGDFNAGMGEPGIQEFLRNGFALARDSGVDAIFYSQAHWSVAGATVGSAFGSDHSPVIVDLQLTR